MFIATRRSRPAASFANDLAETRRIDVGIGGGHLPAVGRRRMSTHQLLDVWAGEPNGPCAQEQVPNQTGELRGIRQREIALGRRPFDLLRQRGEALANRLNLSGCTGKTRDDRCLNDLKTGPQHGDLCGSSTTATTLPLFVRSLTAIGGYVLLTARTRPVTGGSCTSGAVRGAVFGNGASQG